MKSWQIDEQPSRGECQSFLGDAGQMLIEPAASNARRA
jgi:hypothetical protein